MQLNRIVLTLFILTMMVFILNAVTVTQPSGSGKNHAELSALPYLSSGHTGFARDTGNSLKTFSSKDLMASGSVTIIGNFISPLIATSGTIPGNGSFTLYGLAEKDYIDLNDKPTSASYTLNGLFEKSFDSLNGKPTSANYTLGGLSEKLWSSLTGKPTNASYTLVGLFEKSFVNIVGKPTSASYTLNGLSEKDFSSLTDTPNTIASYGILDLLASSTFFAHIDGSSAHGCTAIASAQALSDHVATYSTHGCAQIVDVASLVSYVNGL